MLWCDLVDLEKECDKVPREVLRWALRKLVWMKGRVYASCVSSTMVYGSENRPWLADIGLKLERAEMQMIRWMCGVSMKDRRTSKELSNLS